MTRDEANAKLAEVLTHYEKWTDHPENTPEAQSALRNMGWAMNEACSFNYAGYHLAWVADAPDGTGGIADVQSLQRTCCHEAQSQVLTARERRAELVALMRIAAERSRADSIPSLTEWAGNRQKALDAIFPETEEAKP